MNKKIKTKQNSENGQDTKKIRMPQNEQDQRVQAMWGVIVLRKIITFAVNFLLLWLNSNQIRKKKGYAKLKFTPPHPMELFPQTLGWVAVDKSHFAK